MSQRISENPLLQAAGRFHGHIGPFLAIGMRMGLLANEKLGRAPMETSAVIAVEPKPPKSCLVDGVQFSTGCTMGKCNIKIAPDAGSISASFLKGLESLTVVLRPDFLERMERDLAGAPEKAVIDYAFRIMDTAPDELFEVT